MPAFNWQALDARGRVKKGLTEADSQSALIEKLRQQDLSPTKIEAGKKKSRKQIANFDFLYFKRVSAKTLFTITRQLATLLKQGIPIDSALATIIQQSVKAGSINLLTGIRAKVIEGHTLAQALSEFPQVFPDFYIYTVAAGEKSGNLPLVLESLADYLHSTYTSRQKILLALIYPIFVLIVAFSVIGILLTLVVPDIVKVFAGTNQDLPFITKGLISLSDFLQGNGLAILFGLLVILLSLNYAFKTDTGKLWLHKFLLKLPVYGKLLKNSAALRFIKTLSILLKSKVEITEAINISSQVVNVLPLKNKLSLVRQEVQEGMALGKSLEKTGIFSPLLLSLVASGEKSGALAEMLEEGAEIQEQDLLAAISVVVGVFEPVMILLMGLIVLIIVLAILVPIFDMNTLVR